MKKVTILHHKDGIKVKFEGMWIRVDVEKSFMAMRREMPKYIIEMKKKLEKAKEEKNARRRKEKRERRVD